MDYINLFDKNIIPKEMIKEDVSMKEYTSFKTGGNAGLLVEPQTQAQLSYVLRKLTAAKVPHVMLGNGTNIIFTDEGFDGVVVKLGEGFKNISIEHTQLTAGAGALLSTVAKIAANEGLSGLEFASGIPGSMGGAVFMNAGAYGGEMKDIIKSVTAVSPDGMKTRTFCAADIEMGYRHSSIQDNGYIVTSVVMSLKSGNVEEITAKMSELLKQRNEKQPVSYPSAGSFFKRPTGYFAGKLVQDAGLKGLTVGGAQVSELHSGFIINTGAATTSDILELMKLVQDKVYEQFGVRLEPEVRIIGN